MPLRSPDAVSRPYFDQIAKVNALVEAQAERVAKGRPAWDAWFDTGLKLTTEAREAFAEQAAVVQSIENAAMEISDERARIPDVGNATMLAKVRLLAEASAEAGLPLGERLAADFEAFRDWRKAHLDGIDVDMFALIEQRQPSRPPRGQARPLFDSLFVAWAKTAGVPVAEAERAARAHFEAGQEMAAPMRC